MEITTLFLVLSIGFYVLLFWHSQMQPKMPARNRRRTDKKDSQLNVNLKPHPRRRYSDRGQVETLVINQLFENEDEAPTGTSH